MEEIVRCILVLCLAVLFLQVCLCIQSSCLLCLPLQPGLLLFCIHLYLQAVLIEICPCQTIPPITLAETLSPELFSCFLAKPSFARHAEICSNVSLSGFMSNTSHPFFLSAFSIFASMTVFPEPLTPVILYTDYDGSS